MKGYLKSSGMTNQKFFWADGKENNFASSSDGQSKRNISSICDYFWALQLNTIILTNTAETVSTSGETLHDRNHLTMSVQKNFKIE